MQPADFTIILKQTRRSSEEPRLARSRRAEDDQPPPAASAGPAREPSTGRSTFEKPFGLATKAGMVLGYEDGATSSGPLLSPHPPHPVTTKLYEQRPTTQTINFGARVMGWN